VHHLRTEVREFHHFEVRERLHHPGVVDHAGIAGHDTVHIGPDPDLVCIDTGPNDGCGIVRTAPPERGKYPLTGAAHEPHDHRDLLAEHRPDLCFYPVIALVECSGFAVLGSGEDPCFATIYCHRGNTALTDSSSKDRSEESFTEGYDMIF